MGVYFTLRRSLEMTLESARFCMILPFFYRLTLPSLHEGMVTATLLRFAGNKPATRTLSGHDSRHTL